MSDEIVVYSEKAKRAFTFKNVLAFLGLVLLLASGVVTTLLYAAKDSVDQLKPTFQQAGEHLSALNPGYPQFSISIDGKEITILQGQESGSDWTALTGKSYNSGGGGNSNNNGGDGGTSPSGDDLPVPPPGDDPAADFAKYKTQFIQLVGGTPDVPDFTMLSAGNTKAARQVIALMKSTGQDLVLTTTWNESLEMAVKSKYEACFVAQNLTCVRDWNPLMSTVDPNPPGLRDWLVSVIGDSGAVNDIVNAASNADAQNVLDGILDDMLLEAITQRKVAGCANIQAGKVTPLEIQWCFAGRTVKIVIQDGNNLGNWIPNWASGSWGDLDENDRVYLVDENGNALELTQPDAAQAIPGLTIESNETSFTFPEVAQLWDPAANPWTPGSPLP